MGKDSELVETPADKVYIERESAANIIGKDAREREEIISRIWGYIKTKTDHYRAPGHHPVSSDALIKSSKIEKRSELHIDEKPGRHILYLDDLTLAFRRAKVQARLEIKQAQKKGELCKQFAEVTIKIGDKKTQRVEEAVPVNLDVWREKGFYAALKEGMKSKVEEVQNDKGGEAAEKKKKKFEALKDALKKALQEAVDLHPKDITPYPLVHMHRDTYETEFSPNGYKYDVVEAKTDRCHGENCLGHEVEFAQLEMETIKGNDIRRGQEMDRLIRDVSRNIVPTGDSKEDPSMRILEQILLPQDDSTEEAERVAHNRGVLAEHLNVLEFRQFDAKEIGIKAKPIPAAVLKVA